MRESFNIIKKTLDCRLSVWTKYMTCTGFFFRKKELNCSIHLTLDLFALVGDNDFILARTCKEVKLCIFKLGRVKCFTEMNLDSLSSRFT